MKAMQIETSDTGNVAVTLTAFGISMLLNVVYSLPEIDAIIIVPLLHLVQMAAALVAIASGSIVILKAVQKRFKN